MPIKLRCIRGDIKGIAVARWVMIGFVRIRNNMFEVINRKGILAAMQGRNV